MILLLAQLLLMPDAPHLRYEARRHGLPEMAVLSVAWTETRANTNPRVRGVGWEWGRFQIKESTARVRCPGMNVRRYRGNVACFIKMFTEDAAQFGVIEAICVHNTGKPKVPCNYGIEALGWWKFEELYYPKRRS